MTKSYQIDILGKGNAAIAMLLEIIASNQGEPASVRIVKNRPDDPTESQLPFEHPDVATQVIEHSEWQPSKAGLLLGALQPEAKQAIFSWFSSKYGFDEDQFAILLHNSACLAQGVEVGRGSVAGPNLVVAPYTRIGAFVSINRNVSIGHHTSMGAFCTINPGANIAGLVTIGRGVLIGMGAIVLERVTIGDGAIVAAGALVTKDVEPKTLVAGLPAKVVKVLG